MLGGRRIWSTPQLEDAAPGGGGRRTWGGGRRTPQRRTPQSLSIWRILYYYGGMLTLDGGTHRPYNLSPESWSAITSGPCDYTMGNLA